MPIPSFNEVDVTGGKTFAEMYTMLQSPEFRQPCEMCVRRQAAFQAEMADKPEDVALANGVLGNSWMDIESLMNAVSTDPEGHLTIGDDAKMFEIVEKVWPYVAKARYQGVVANPPMITYTTLPPPPGTPEPMPLGSPEYVPQPGVIEYPPPPSSEGDDAPTS